MFSVRRKKTEAVDLRVEPSELGLARHPELGTFLQFSAIGSRAARESLNRLAAVVARVPGQAIVIEVTVNSSSSLQRRLGVRHVPSVYLLDQRGVVTHHWARPPMASELEEALGMDTKPLAVAAQAD
jgi:hypothetical protein